MDAGVADRDGVVMGYRISWIAGITGLAFTLARVERLLRPSGEGMPWEIILVAALALGATVTWAGLAYRLRSTTVLAINAVAMTLTMIRVAVPQTTWFLFPTQSSFPALSAELAFARDVIRVGVPPVIPLSGIVAILAVVFWGMGAVLTWGLLTGRPYLAVLTPLVVYLEFAVMDRRPGGMWTTAFMIVLGFALLAVALDRRREGIGPLTSSITRTTLVRSLPSVGVLVLATTMVVAAGASAAMASLVPYNGFLDWRVSSGLSGEYFGSITYNPFVGIRQNLLSQTPVPVFVATVAGDVPDNRLYWRLVTLDAYNGGQWYIGDTPRVVSPQDVETFERGQTAFAGPTATATASVTVLALQMDWLPAPYAPTSLAADNRAVEHGLRVRTDDGSLRFDALTYRGMSYTVTSEIPLPDLDVLGRLDDGSPSVVFRQAVADGEFAFRAEAPEIVHRQLPDEEKYLALPDDLDFEVTALARRHTRGLQTDFEKALALEAFLRDPENFRYSTDIEPGHGATDLADWLLDPESANYRTGYCEQFATSMAVMARAVGLPSRVVLGFGPGTRTGDGRLVVRDANAHAWVEVWMSTQGWVRFDPTPLGDTSATSAEVPFALDRYLDIPEPDAPIFGGGLVDPPLDDPDRPVPDTPGGTAGGRGSGGVIPRWAYVGGIVAAVAFGLLPAVKWARSRRRARRLMRGDISAAWAEIVDRLTDLGAPPLATRTPAETAAATDPVMRPLAEVYAEFTYGPEASLPEGRIALASRSLAETEARLIGRYSWGRRALARYRVASLLPPRLASRRRR